MSKSVKNRFPDGIFSAVTRYRRGREPLPALDDVKRIERRHSRPISALVNEVMPILGSSPAPLKWVDVSIFKSDTVT